MLSGPFEMSGNVTLVMIESAVAIMAKVKFRIDCIEILAVQMILNNPQRFTETLIVYDFPFS